MSRVRSRKHCTRSGEMSQRGIFYCHVRLRALSAVGRGGPGVRTGEKTKSLVRASDRLYRAKVKHYGLRTGTRRCSSLEVRLACTAGTQKACHGGGARLCGAAPQYPVLSIAWQQNWDAEATRTARLKGWGKEPTCVQAPAHHTSMRTLAT